MTPPPRPRPRSPRGPDNRALRLYTTAIPTEHRLRTLMHDPQYRLSIVWQNVAYNQPPHTWFHLGGPATSAARRPPTAPQ